MKRVLIVLAALLLPLSVMAMTPVSDNDLSNVTGQAGVTIGVSQMNITLDFDTLTYGDLDGDAVITGGTGDLNGDGNIDAIADIDYNGDGDVNDYYDEPTTGIDYNGDGDTDDVFSDVDYDSDGVLDVGGETAYTYATDYNAAGFINMSIEDVPMHVNLAALTLTIDVGTDSLGETAVVIGISNFSMTLDAFAIKAIYLDSTNGVASDYGYNNNPAIDSAFDPVGYYSEWTTATHTPIVGLIPTSTKSLGWVGISGLGVSIPSATITISAH